MDWISRLADLERLLPGVTRTLVQWYLNTAVSDNQYLNSYLGNDCSVWEFHDATVLSDSPERQLLDSVFPPHPESVLLYSLIPRAFGNGVFVDVGTGSGILSIVAAKRGWRSIAVDINPRALQVAGLNADINSVHVNRIEDDLAQSQRPLQAQFCIANLPFESTPENCPNYLHSDGGRYGDKLINRFMDVLPSFVAEGGTVLLPAFALVKDGRSRLEDRLSTQFDNGFESAVLRLSPMLGLQAQYLRYRNSGWKTAYKELKSEGYTHFCIDLAIIRRTTGRLSRYLGVYYAPIADQKWILPIGTERLGVPRAGLENQNSG